MSKNVAVFIDVANLYYAARGQDVDVDYVALLKHATKGRDLIRAYAYSGLDPENENQRKFLDFLSKNGYKVVHKDIRKFGDGRVKANLDIELVVDLFRLAPRMDIAVVISGDGDFASAIRALQDIGVRCEVISFRPNTSSDLIAVADEFTDIMKIIGIGRKKGEKGISMPEMPAKEVNPEFGFREASRGVAAAALAALREGEKPAGRTRRGHRAPAQAGVEPVAAGVPAADEASAELAAEPVEPMTALEAHVDGTNGDSTRRRRRRRGGRGRGRGRRSEAQDEPVSATGEGESPEIGWQEFDDLSQLGLTDLGEPGGEREYAFEEADPQTLAELGIEPETTLEPAEPAVPDGEAIEAQPSAAGSGRRARGGGRRTRGATAASAGTGAIEASSSGAAAKGRAAAGTRAGSRAANRRQGAADASSAGDEARPARSRQGASRRTKAAAAEETAEAAKPAPRRRASSRAGARTRSSATNQGEGRGRTGDQPPAGTTGPSGENEAGGGEEGIWQRFRSGRRTTRDSS
ncbi:MAG: NYN domain-containing protein [Chloroflexi bacterium]|nr:MAG: NYN domain-containing protein [Chloroflexota bacterium]